MLQYIIPLIATYMPMFEYALWYVFAFMFVIAVPGIILAFVRK